MPSAVLLDNPWAQACVVETAHGNTRRDQYAWLIKTHSLQSLWAMFNAYNNNNLLSLLTTQNDV